VGDDGEVLVDAALERAQRRVDKSARAAKSQPARAVARGVGGVDGGKYPMLDGKFGGVFPDVNAVNGEDLDVLKATFLELRELKRERLRAGACGNSWLDVVGEVTEAVYREVGKRDHKWEMQFLKIQDDDANIVRYKMRGAQEILRERIWELDASGRPVRVVLGKPRQFGGSTEIAAYIYEKTKWKINSRGLVVADKGTNSTNLFGMYARFYAHDPTRRQAEVLAKSLVYDRVPGGGDVDAEEWVIDDYDMSDIISLDEDDMLSKKINGGYIQVETGGAKQAGRSRTAQFLHCSEVAFFETPETTMTALLQIIPPYPDTAIFLESTANGVGGWYYEKWRESDDGYTRIFIPWHIVEKYRKPLTEREQKAILDSLTEYEENLVSNHGVTAEQLGWRRDKIKENHGNEDFVKQEYPSTDEEMFIGSGRPVFQIQVVKGALDKVKEEENDGIKPRRYHLHLMAGSDNQEYRTARSQRGKLFVWDKPQKYHEYVIGVDPAEGGVVNQGSRDPDYTVIQIGDRGGYANDPEAPLSQVAEYEDRPDVIHLPGFIEILSEWYNRAWVCVEANNHGLGVINTLIERGFTRLMVRPSPEVIESIKRGTKEFGIQRTQLPTSNKNKFGWFTGPKTRPIMIDALNKYFYNGELIVRSKETLFQMQRFLYNDDGRPEASTGSHDDRVMGLALMVQCDAFTLRSSRLVKKKKTLEQEFLEMG
jgi:hypothetical protein